MSGISYFPPSGTVTAPVGDASLASPNNSVYKIVHKGTGSVPAAATTGTKLLVSVVAGNVSSATTMAVGLVAGASIFNFTAAEYAVAGKTTKMNVQGATITNATAPGTISFAFGLYPVTSAGGTDVITLTPGALVTGSTATVTNPLLSTITPATGSDFDVPPDGAYILACAMTGTVPTASLIAMNAFLRIRNV